MTFHLLTIWVGVAVCRDYSSALVSRVVEDSTYGIDTAPTACANLETTLTGAVDKYLSVILSLIGGAAVSGGVAAVSAPVSTSRKEDEE